MPDPQATAKSEWVQRVLGLSVGAANDSGSDLSELESRFKTRLQRLLPRIQQAAGAPSGQDAKLKASEAGVFARKQDFARANALLDDAERLLGASAPPTTSAPQPSAPQPSAPQPARAVSPSVAFTQSRLIWDQTRKQIQSELQKLEQTVLAECKNEPDFATISGNSKILYTILDFLDERLIDKLDEALNAKDPADRKARQNEAREIINEYVDYIAADELLHDIDDNGFIDIAIAATLNQQLGNIDRQLRAIAA